MCYMYSDRAKRPHRYPDLAEVETFLGSVDLPPLPPIDEAPAAPKRKKKPQDNAAKARVRRKAYLERQKLERETLKCQVEELTSQLEQAQTRVASPFTSSWKMLTTHQQEQRRNSEAQQRRLCAEIVARAALVRDFRGVVQGTFANERRRPLHQHKRNRLEPSDVELYKVYVGALDDLYSQTDVVLHFCGLNLMEEDRGGSKNTWMNSTTSGHFQLTDKHVVPFEFQETCRSRWLAAHRLHRQEDRKLYHRLQDSERTVAFKFRLTARLVSGKIASVQQRIAIRRYEEDERMVIVWRAFMEGEGIFTGMHADEIGWGVATPFKGASKVALHGPVAKQFAGVVPDSGVENNVEITNALENLLLQNQ